MTPHEDIYERLRMRWTRCRTASPERPPAWSSLIKMAFTEEEVWLAGQLTRIPETAAEIATRVGRDVGDVTATLESLIPRRLVRLDSPGMAAPGLAPTTTGEKKYRLGPFLVGWYEAMMRLQDKEFAALFEQFVIEGGGERIFAPRPGVLGVVPVRGSLKPEYIQREPHLDIDAHFQRHERFLVIPCVCKREMELLHGHSCRKPMKRCGFVGLPPQTPLGETVLDREEASKLLGQAREDGARPPRVLRLHHERGLAAVRRHVQLLLLLLRDLPRPEAGRRARRARRNRTTAPSSIPTPCTACGACILRCPVDAISEGPSACPPAALAAGRQAAGHRQRTSVVDRDKCIGCGVCVIGCAARRDRDGAGLRGGVVPRPVEHGGVGGDAPGASGRAERMSISPVHGCARMV